MGRRGAITLLVALGLLAAACGGGDDSATDDTRPTATSLIDDGPAVRTEERTFASLPTLVVRPAGEGPFPLIVFVHGAGAPPEFYGPLLEDLAAAGNVVVAPAMPGSVDHSDFTALVALPFQPGRVEQVLDAVTTGPQAIHAADPERVVVMGHSLGAMTALAIGFNSCCLDQRIDAVVSIAGEMATFPGGRWASGSLPLFLVHGEDDEVVPFSGSGQALQQLGTPAYLLAVEGGDHTGYLAPEDRAFPAVVAAIVSFFEATIGGDPRGGLADLTSAGSMPGVRLTTRG
jgi:dipeptidyl aminopeptidase/acylaminoacyl peptidase